MWSVARGLLKLAIPVFMGITLGSCALVMKPVGYSYRVAPEIKLNMPAKLGLVNRFDPERLHEGKKKLSELYSEGVLQVIEGLRSGQGMETDIDLEILEVHDLQPGFGYKGFMPGSEAECVLDSFNMDYLMVLEFFDSSFDTETVVERNEDGSKDRTNVVYLTVETGFSLYGRDGGMLDQGVYSRTEHYQNRMTLTSIFVIGPSMKRSGKKLLPMAREVGAEYMRKFYPSTVSEVEFVYASEPFDLAYAAILKGEWEAAQDLTLPALRSEDKMIVRRARKNLEVINRAILRMKTSYKD